MTLEKFNSEIETLKKFFPIYCNDKHDNQIDKFYSINYKDKEISFNIKLCNECHNMLDYSIQRLKECPHEDKPRCRKCPTPCYEKEEWKKMAKMMRYSGMKLGVTKSINKIKSLFRGN